MLDSEHDDIDIIVDYITGRINTLEFTNKEVQKRLGHKDPLIEAKVRELEDMRSYIAIKFY